MLRINGVEATHLEFMSEALALALQARDLDEVPVGAIIVKNGEILARTHNLKESSNSPTGHAEILAIEQAAKKLNSWRLLDCTLYVTLEPCLMCSGAIISSRLSRLVFAALDPKAGAVQSLYQTLNDPRLNHRPEILSGFLAAESSRLLSDFFRSKR